MEIFKKTYKYYFFMHLNNLQSKFIVKLISSYLKFIINFIVRINTEESKMTICEKIDRVEANFRSVVTCPFRPQGMEDGMLLDKY